MANKTIHVAGGGPAGLMAALAAAECGAKVTVLEKMEKPARKLRITGKGRCNLTNVAEESDFLEEIFPDGRFFRPSFRHFSSFDLMTFLNRIGIATIVERGARVFPAPPLRAWDVAEALVKEVKRKATVVCQAKVTGFDVENGAVVRLRYERDGRATSVATDALIVATGGLAYPLTGSTGDGYSWAQHSGHTIVAPRPSLVGLELGDYSAEMRGVALRNVALSLSVDGEVVQQEFGEMEFTDYGIDGPTVLKISRRAVDAVRAGKDVNISVNLKPALSCEQLTERIRREIASLPDTASVGDLLKTLLPLAAIRPFADRLRVSLGKRIGNFPATETEKLVATLVGLRYPVTGFRPFAEAIVTAGGVALSDVDPRSMRSRHVTNLFFAGEVLDLDACTGGYNLQIAFSTGRLAGTRSVEL
jgi:predicted Rossmann fold flavoprotein